MLWAFYITELTVIVGILSDFCHGMASIRERQMVLRVPQSVLFRVTINIYGDIRPNYSKISSRKT